MSGTGLAFLYSGKFHRFTVIDININIKR